MNPQSPAVQALTPGGSLHRGRERSIQSLGSKGEEEISEQCTRNPRQTILPSRAGPLQAAIPETAGSLPGDGLAAAASKTLMHRIIDVYSHQLSCHLNRQLNNSRLSSAVFGSCAV